MTTSHVRLSSSASPHPDPGVLGRAVVSVPGVLRRRTAGGRESAWRTARGAAALHSEEDRMRLLAALLVLATLLLWIVFLQG